MSMDCLGLLCLTLRTGAGIKSTLDQYYGANEHPVAYLDESFDLAHARTFYIVGLAVVKKEYLHNTRETLLDFYDREALHAAPMYDRREDTTLRQATELVARNHDGLDVVVCAPISGDDKTGEAARRRCLEYLLPKIQDELQTGLFIFDKRNLMKQDEYVASDLRRAKELSRDTIVYHCQPSEEPLLGLPDVLAWSYRQDYRGHPQWFDPMREKTEVKVLGAPRRLI
ncbi:hypothetical protein [Arthrobacter sp. zg-Y769]|uniref:hypothetical protein n=1 Tax=Arthrobacter sp. zg-Y769 TaxID=2894191 RepID=UPI001E4B7BBC|nr:hypothetical protein [Arthrobacter sp. zg-Y769]MCC9205867.1 hypothetical protein [Arthrobacter sp. zg-Y769]